jgi:hypothetical protein
MEARRAEDLAEKLRELVKERDNLDSTVKSLSGNPFLTQKEGASSIKAQVDRVR